MVEEGNDTVADPDLDDIDRRMSGAIEALRQEFGGLRTGRASIAESYAAEEKGKLVLVNANIPIYPASRDNHEPKRVRPLLVSRKERDKLLGMIRRDGYTLVPLILYFTEKGIAKLQLGLARGRKKHDKREADKQRDWDRQKSRLLRAR